jgi:hypothetical protein
MALRSIIAVLAALAALPCPDGKGCSICNSQGSTLRQDAGQAKLVLYGTVTASKLAPEGTGGTSTFSIEKVIKNDPFLGDKKVIELPRYVPVDKAKPQRFLIFCDVFKEKLDPYRGTPAASPAVVEYLQGSLALDVKDTSNNLNYFFKYLDHKDGDVAADAFLELARASDKDLGQAAAKFDAAKIRAWVQDPQLPTDRLNLYGFLLGACGTDRDGVLLRTMLQKADERTTGAYQGLLCGYIQIRPREGWDLAHEILKDANKPFTQRYAVLRSLRFFHGWKPQETNREVTRGLGMAVEQGDVADLAVEDLRRSENWDLTAAVLAQFGKKSHAAPIVQRSIVRYALNCPKPEAKTFIAAVGKQDAEMVKDVEEQLQFEKK